MNKTPLFLREQIIHAVRAFFLAQNFHEATPTLLSSSLPLEPTLYPFQTAWHCQQGKKDYYLATSPEAYLKKLLANGFGNCFAISKSFRDLENAGSLHQPEFLMLEWYRLDATYKEIMKDTEDLLLFIYHALNQKRLLSAVQTDLFSENLPWEGVTMSFLFSRYAHIQLEEIMNDKKMQSVAAKKGYSVAGATWEQLFNQIFLNEIEPHLEKKPCFITNFPAKISPLCKKISERPRFAQRFELYLDGIELANGNTENTDSSYILHEFQKEQKSRVQKNIASAPIDSTFIQALASMKDHVFAGAGMGIDRLTMILAGTKTIQETELCF